MTESAVTPDREALRLNDCEAWVEVAARAFEGPGNAACEHNEDPDAGAYCQWCAAETAVDALRPEVAVLVDQAEKRGEQRGRQLAAEAIEAHREAIRFCLTQSAFEDLHSSLRSALVHFNEAAALARGADDRKDDQ